MRFTYLIAILSSLSLLATSCVDDYTDANPAPTLDAPHLRVSSTGSNQSVELVPVNAFQSEYKLYANYGQLAEFTVSVVDAPGKINSITVSSSVPDFGTITLDESSAAALAGQEQGDFKFTFLPNPDLSTTTSRSLNFTVQVSDSQVNEKGESSPKTTTLTLPVTLVNAPCLSSGIKAGTYVVSSASGNLDGGDLYTLESLVANSEGVFAGNIIRVVITQDRPGVYTFDEITGGVWPINYGTKPKLKIDLCGNSLTGRVGSVSTGSGANKRTYTINGSLNSDGSINIEWSYVKDNGSTPENPAKGTYTLVPLQ